MTIYLYSIRAQHAVNILNGKKTIEIRKSAPKPPFVMWIYETLGKKKLSHIYEPINPYNADQIGIYKGVDYAHEGCGLVVAKCVVETVTKLQYERWPNPNMETYMVPSYKKNGVLINDGNVSILEGAKLNLTELLDYGKGAPLYALHLTQLEILDKPLQVTQFMQYKTYQIGAHKEDILEHLTRAPQSYQKVIPPEVRK